MTDTRYECSACEANTRTDPHLTPGVCPYCGLGVIVESESRPAYATPVFCSACGAVNPRHYVGCVYALTSRAPDAPTEEPPTNE